MIIKIALSMLLSGALFACTVALDPPAPAVAIGGLHSRSIGFTGIGREPY